MTVTLRGTSSRFYSIFIAVAAGILLIAGMIHGGIHELIWTLPATLFMLALAWVMFWNPRLVIGPGGLHVINLFREHHIPWADFSYAENRWGLYLYSRSHRKISVWAVPSNVGLFSNSWRDRKKQRKDPTSLTWADSGAEHRYCDVPFAADLITMRAQQIARHSSLRRELSAQLDTPWPTQTTARWQIIPLALLGVTLAVLVWRLAAI
ncbi:PH domain-containing protein [Trueperella sp. LYQ143]|uniref:PH domain-containing protein n=1 Tax=unclassified Trueperella TaxID=2630174 RepID=UPI00398308FC